MWTLFATIFGFISMAATLSSEVCIHYEDVCAHEKTHTLNCNDGVIRVRSVNVKIGAVTSQVQSENCDCRIDIVTCEVDVTDEARYCYGEKQCEIPLTEDMPFLNYIREKCRPLTENRPLLLSTVIEYTCYSPPDGATDNNDGGTNTSSIVIAAAVSALVVIAIVVIVLVVVILYKRNKKRKHARSETVARYHSNRGIEGDYNTIPADHDNGSRHDYATLDVDGRFGASGSYRFAQEVPDGGYDKVKPDNGIDKEKNGAKTDANGYGRINNGTYDKIRHNKPPNTRPNVGQDDYSHLSEQNDDYSHLGNKPVKVHDTGNDYNRLHEHVKPPAHSYGDAISSGSTKSNDKTEVNVDDIVLKRTGSYEEPTTLASDKHVNITEHGHDIDMENIDRTRRGSYEEPMAIGSDKQLDNTEDNADDIRDIGRNRKGSYEEPTLEKSEKHFKNAKDNARKDDNISYNVNLEQMNQDSVQLPTKEGDSDDSSSSDDD